MDAHNRRLNWLFEDLGKFNLTDDLSNTDEVLPSLSSVEIGLDALGKVITDHQVDNVFGLFEGSSKIVERFTKYLQKSN